MISNLKFRIIEELKKRGTYHVSVNGVQHYTRCPFCGDSPKQNHAHLGIRIDVSQEDPMVYNCLRCPVSGLVNDTFLEELGIFLDSEARKDLKGFTKRSMKVAKLTNMDREKFIVPLYEKSGLNDRKLDYINRRLGINMDYSSAKDHKIILNVYDFMKANDILKRDRMYFKMSNKMLEILNTFYVGFLSTNNNCVIFRDITGTQKYRYFKATMNEKNINMDSFYSVPGKLDIMYTHDIHIHVAEGVFDILSIKENLIQDISINYFYATCGFGGVSVLKYLIHHAMTTGIHLHLYSDNDKTDWEHRKYLFTKSYLNDWIDEILLHRNNFPGEKDFGVPNDHIKDKFRKLERK